MVLSYSDVVIKLTAKSLADPFWTDTVAELVDSADDRTLLY
jgi:hypothetical protein